MSRRFAFDLYRLNVEDAEDLFAPLNVLRMRSDDVIRSVLVAAATRDHDLIQKTKSAIFSWSVRDFLDLTENSPRPMLRVVLARSVLEREGPIVTDDGMRRGKSASSPPLASTAVCLFDMSRHLVLVERASDLPQSQRDSFLELALEQAAARLGIWSRIRLEPIPKKNEITGLFRSFDRITRMKLTLRIPNPELNRYTAAIYEDMKIGGIREMTQDMRNPSGLSLSQDARPYASAVLAEQGYKKGEVQLEGVRNGEWEEARSGSVAARGGVSGLRDFIRGLSAIAKAKETQRALEAVAAEVDRVHPREPEHG